eukprot:6197559-Pleurochrysis_carterae.AAC.1
MFEKLPLATRCVRSTAITQRTLFQTVCEFRCVQCAASLLRVRALGTSQQGRHLLLSCGRAGIGK